MCKAKALLKPHTQCFQDRCMHGPAPSKTESADRGQQPPAAQSCSRRQAGGRRWQAGSSAHAMTEYMEGPGPPVPEVSFRVAK